MYVETKIEIDFVLNSSELLQKWSECKINNAMIFWHSYFFNNKFHILSCISKNYLSLLLPPKKKKNYLCLAKKLMLETKIIKPQLALNLV